MYTVTGQRQKHEAAAEEDAFLRWTCLVLEAATHPVPCVSESEKPG